MASIKTSMLSKFAMLCTAFNTVRNTICHTKLHIELEVRLSSFNRSRQLKLLFYFHNELRDRTKYNTKKLCIVSKAMDKIFKFININLNTFTGQASGWFHSWNINNFYSAQAIRLCIATFSNDTKSTPVEKEERK